MQWQKDIFLFGEIISDDCSCHHKKEGQFATNTRSQYLIDKQYLPNELSI